MVLQHFCGKLELRTRDKDPIQNDKGREGGTGEEHWNIFEPMVLVLVAEKRRKWA